jgi:hypothetical protein
MFINKEDPQQLLFEAKKFLLNQGNVIRDTRNRKNWQVQKSR